MQVCLSQQHESPEAVGQIQGQKGVPLPEQGGTGTDEGVGHPSALKRTRQWIIEKHR